MKKSLFAILVTLLFLLATDMIFRLIGYRTVNKVFIDRTQLRRTDKVYGCSLVPNSDVGKYRINEQGYREDHFIPSARSDREKIRILALGDSIIFGAEVENNESICCRLESLIAASLEEGDEVEVINTAVMWWGPTQYLSRYELEGSAFNPDCVIIGGCPNDVTDVIAMEKLMASGSVIEHRYYQDLVVGRDPMNESHAGAFALYTIASFLMRHSAFANYLDPFRKLKLSII